MSSEGVWFVNTLRVFLKKATFNLYMNSCFVWMFKKEPEASNEINSVVECAYNNSTKCVRIIG